MASASAPVPARQRVPRELNTRQPKSRRRAHQWDHSLAVTVFLLLAIGLVALYSASYSVGYYRYNNEYRFIFRQAIFAGGGVFAMIGLSKVPYSVYKGAYRIILCVALVLLVLVLTPLGTTANNAQRWLFGFQPSELAKLAVIICFARWIENDPDSVRSLRSMIKPYGVLLVGIAGLLLLEPHTSATIIIFAIGVIMMFVAGMKLWYFIPVGILGGAMGVVFYTMLEHVRTRISIWLDPFSDIAGAGFQGAMSQIAIGSGGFFGLGLGQGRQKHLYLPEPQNDFIFSTWCEEMGFIGALIVIVLFAYLIYRGFTVARMAPDRFSALVATGITAKLAIQTLMNLCVVSGVIPVTGASLPFFSYGGTALLMQLAEMGILLNISRYMRIDARQAD